jgi:hypothetical protein
LAAVIIVMVIWIYLLWHVADQRQRLRQQIETFEYRNALAIHLAARIANRDDHKPDANAVLTPLAALPGLNVQVMERHYRITGTVLFDTWVAWLADQQRSAHVILTSARIRKTSVPGQVELDGELERVP